MNLYDCFVHIISYPILWSDHVTISKEIMANNFQILQKYFPQNLPTMDHILPVDDSAKRILCIKLISPTATSNASLTSASSSSSAPSDLPSSISIWGKKYTIKPNVELSIPVPTEQRIIHLKFNNSIRTSFKYPLSQLLSQRPIVLQPEKTNPVRVQYLYQASRINLATLFPSINNQTYPEILKRLDLITTEPPPNLQWVVDEFARQFQIDPIARTRTYIQSALAESTFFNRYTLDQLVYLVSATDRTQIAQECTELLGRFQRILKRYDLIYPVSNMESYEGCISRIIHLVQKLSPQSDELLRECVHEHIEFNYNLFKMNDEDDCIPSTSSAIAVLAQTTQNITNTLINFAKYYDQEFSPYFNMLLILSTKYYRKLSDDVNAVFSSDLILAPELVDLHDNLYNLHTILTSCALIDPRDLLKFEYLFSPHLVKYLNKTQSKLLKLIPAILQTDTFESIGKETHHSKSIFDLFVFISYSSVYVYKFKFDLTPHKLHLLHIVEEVLENYIRTITLIGHNLAESAHTEPLQCPTSSTADPSAPSADPFFPFKLCVILHNIIHARSKLEKLIGYFKVDYSFKNLDCRIDASIDELVERLVHSLPLDNVLGLHLTDFDSFAAYVDELLCKITAMGLPDEVFHKILNSLFGRIIHRVEDHAWNGTLPIDRLKPFIQSTLPPMIDLFHGEGKGVSKDTLRHHCHLLEELNSCFTSNLELNDVRNHSVFVIQVLAPKHLSIVLKSIRRLGYTKLEIIRTWSKCHYKRHSGYLFETEHSVDFISKNGRKSIRLDSSALLVQNGRLRIGSYEFTKIIPM